MSNQEYINQNKCIDCSYIMATIEEQSNGAICEGCSNPICEECVITDNECYECSECYNNNGA
jgi:hypothetical protein